MSSNTNNTNNNKTGRDNGGGGGYTSSSSTSSPTHSSSSRDESYTKIGDVVDQPNQLFLDDDNADNENNNNNNNKQRGMQSMMNLNKSLLRLRLPTTCIKSANDIKDTLKRYLAFYVKYTSTTLGQDNILKLCHYGFIFLGRYYFQNKKNNNKNGSNHPNTSQVLSENMIKLGYQICWARYVNRLFGLPMSLEACIDKDKSWAPGIIGQLLSWSMVGYYPFEALAYLKWQIPDVNFSSILFDMLGISNNLRKRIFFNRSSTTTTSKGHTHGGSGMKWDNNDMNNNTSLVVLDESRLASVASAWSVRFWLIYIVVDIIRSIKVIREEKKKQSQEMMQQLKNNRTIETNNKTTTTTTKSTTTTNNTIHEADDEDNHDDDNNDTANNNEVVLQDNKEDDDDDEATTKKRKFLLKIEKLQLLRNMLFFLPGIQWSLDKWDTQPWLSPDLINNLMLLEAFVSVYQSMTKCAQAS